MRKRAEMTRMVDLVQFEPFWDWMCEQPVRSRPPWALHVLKESTGNWLRARIFDYQRGLDRLIEVIEDGVFDAALVAPVLEYEPPILGYKKVKRKITKKNKKGEIIDQYWVKVDKPIYWNWPREHGERWCPHCRRPTVFRVLRRHAAINGRDTMMKNLDLIPEPRCVICGMRWDSLSRRAQSWGK